MLSMFTDQIQFSNQYAGKTLSKTYNLYPHQIKQISASLSGIDYGFTDVEGMFFRSQIQVKHVILSPTSFRIDVTFGFRSRNFDKRTDATIQYNVIVEYT
ncbi:hypothetical protein [Paenibacillus cremeus]|uniref:Uncharacterized protein n=1 Tax=Paenibacillus cremeus TaxID=2163881 RepID=A0A559JIG3_9BACL|nr:hypothetical protein [Paenibacillus cremeus]TVX99662.1 hypothetical protein FPZ49_33645 [Paenibacillus cremeus]